MPFSEVYRKQAALVVRALPEVAREECFALKGGTGINLFTPGYWPFRLGVMRGGKLSRLARDPWPPHFATPGAPLHKNRRPHGSGLQFNGFIVSNFQLTP